MRTSIFAFLCLSLTATSAFAAPDFGQFAMCQTLRTPPPGAIPAPNCAQNRFGECSFRMRGDPANIAYLLINGVLADKTYTLRGNEVGPFGVRRSDTMATVKRRLEAMRGVRMTNYDASEALADDTAIYLESNRFDCSGNSYTLSVFFSRAGRPISVSVSTLPVI
jgi:hypothetical protein